MTALSFGLLVISAILHTSWNFLLKNIQDRFLAIWWAILIGSSVFLPLLFFSGLPNPAIWPWFLASVVVEILYYSMLGLAYSIGDFSVVYPFARGSAPLFLLAWSHFFLGEELTLVGSIGVGILILGLALITSGAKATSNSASKPAGVLVALAVGLLISVYTAIDGYAVKQTDVLGYGILLFFALPVFSFPVVYTHYGHQRWLSVITSQPFKISIVGVFSVAAYLLALFAYQNSVVGYSGSVREISVVFGAFAGWFFLKEQLGRRRLAGSFAIFAALLLIGFWG